MKNNINKKPGLAAFFSVIFPGAGFFYLGNYMRGFVHLGIFIFIIGILTSSNQEEAIFGLLLAGTYLFQIFDAYNYGCKLSGKQETRLNSKINNIEETAEKIPFEQERLSLTGSIIILILGIFLQLVNLDIINFGDIFKYWPILLIAIGIKLIFQSYQGGKDE